MTIDSAKVEHPIQFCIQTILKEARREDRLVKQIFYTMISAYSNSPVNLAINSPTGEGKTWDLHKVGDKFPKEDVVFLAGMTDKALFHRHGTLVVKDDTREKYVAVDDKIAQIDLEIEDKDNEIALSNNKDLRQGLRNHIKDLEKQKKDLLKDAKKLIDLSHKILVFLDTPRPELFNALMPLLSHDKYEVEYEYVDTHNGIKTRTNILRGWPAVIFAQAIDYSHYARWPEIQRRFIITNPKMEKAKYEDAIDLIGHKCGLPDFAYQQKVVTDMEKDRVIEIIQDLKMKMLDVSGKVEPGKNHVFIPFYEVLTKSLPKEKAFDMTTANRFFGFLSLLPTVNIDRRPRIIFRKKGDPIAQIIPFALFEDLGESIFLMEYANGVRPYVLEWYYDVFLKAYEEKTEPDFKVKKARRKDDEDEIIVEKRKGVTTEQLVEKTREVNNKTYTTKEILDTYVNPLNNQGYIDKTDSDLDKRSNIYYPVIITKNRKLFENEKSNNLSQEACIVVMDPILYPSKQYLVSKIQEVLRYSETNDVFMKIEDHEGKEINAEELVDRYYNNPEKYFDLGSESKDNQPGDNADGLSDRPRVPVMQNKESVPISEQEEGKDKNNFAKEDLHSEYLENGRITSESQQITNQNIITVNSESVSSGKSFEDQKSNNFIYSCYYCDNCQTNIKREYECHVVLKHPGKICYLGKMDLERLGIEGQGKSWEK